MLCESVRHPLLCVHYCGASILPVESPSFKLTLAATLEGHALLTDRH